MPGFRYFVLGIFLEAVALTLIGLHASWWAALGISLFLTGHGFVKNAGQLEVQRFTTRLVTGKRRRLRPLLGWTVIAIMSSGSLFGIWLALS